jgi:endonuclease/exonuclease/phosphatase family metal-dependent hydrolase
MRLVSYNILDGGEGRADPLAEVILAQRPDIVALVEADNLATLERIASRLNMDFIHAPGNKSAAALLSRWPIARTINHALLQRGQLEKSLLEAHVTEPDSDRTWTIGVVHLHAKATEEDERQREREIAVVLEVFASHRAEKRPHLLAGDFNANAPYQQIDPAKCKPATREAWEKNGGQLPRRVVQRILDAGYVDTMRVVDPAASETLGSFSTQDPGQRVDYVFAFGIDALGIRSAWIEQDRLAKYASDHFPIGAELT